jgi:hypothetical protein
MIDLGKVVGSNTQDAVIVLLAAAAIGALFTSLAGDMGETVSLSPESSLLFADSPLGGS